LGWGVSKKTSLDRLFTFHRGEEVLGSGRACCRPAPVLSYTPSGCPYAQTWR
jgi:hypothetical protein